MAKAGIQLANRKLYDGTKEIKMSELLESYIDEIVERHKVNASQAKNLLKASLNSAIISDKIHEMIDFIVKG